jgi:hypothetical protein
MIRVFWHVYLLVPCALSLDHTIYQEFLSIFFVAVYLPPQTDAGTKTALNELCRAISKQENAH